MRKTRKTLRLKWGLGLSGRFLRNHRTVSSEYAPGSPFCFPSPLPLAAEKHPLLAAFNGLNSRPQSVILLSYKNISAILSRLKGVPPLPAESKASVQVKNPPASASIQQRNLALAEMSGQEPSAQA
jgi:hypothetical protein